VTVEEEEAAEEMQVAMNKLLVKISKLLRHKSPRITIFMSLLNRVQVLQDALIIAA
jgi:hypothetical protein